MRLERAGEYRFSGYAEAFKDRDPDIQILSDGATVSLRVGNADGMGASGRYEYLVSLQPNDLTRILLAIAQERTAFDGGPLQDALAKASAALFRLAVASTQLPHLMPPSAKELKRQAARERLERMRRSKEGKISPDDHQQGGKI